MNLFARNKPHVFDKIAVDATPQIKLALHLLEIGYGGKKQMRAAHAHSEPIFVLLFALVNSYIKVGLHCSGQRQSGLVAFKYATELWLNTAFYQNQKTQVQDVITVHEGQPWHHVAPECFVDHLYEVLPSLLRKIEPATKHEKEMAAALAKTCTNLFAEYNVPLTIVGLKKAKAGTDGKPRKEKEAASKPKNASKEPASKPKRASKKSPSKSPAKEPTLAELKSKAADCKIKGRSAMNKAALMAAVKKC